VRAVRAILRRELLATFATPIAYVTVGLLSVLLGAIFIVATLRTGEPATLRAVFLAASWAMLAAAPAIAMRSFSEEFRQGTWETLLAAPIQPWQAVLGKFLAGLVLLTVLVGLPGVTIGAVLEYYADPDWGEIVTGMVGLILAGAAFLALGMLVSTLTSNQLVAFLVPVFVLFGTAFGSRAVAAIVPAAWGPAAFGLDPLRRVEDFVLGLIDTSNVVYFVALIVALLAIASMSLGRIRDGGFGGGARSMLGRFGWRMEAGVFTVGAIVAALAVASLAGTPRLRMQIDATKTRAYTLSPSTEALLRSLQGAWSVHLIVSSERANPATLRRVDEVLAQMQRLAPDLVATRIDPDDSSDPAAAARYESLLESLTTSNAPAIAQWEPSLQSAIANYDVLRGFARSELPLLTTLLQTISPDDPTRPQLEKIAGGLAQLSEEGDAFITAVKGLLKTEASRPLPDYDSARSALVANDRLWADEFSTAIALFEQWTDNPSLDPAVRGWSRTAVQRFTREATRRRSEQLQLEELPPLELGEVGRVIGEGECAVVMGPRGAVAIPSWQIVPAQAAATGRATLGFDFAARAESTLAGAIRSLTVERMPMVVFVHAEEASLLAGRVDRSDVAAMSDTLRSARYIVREWPVSSGDRPVPARGQRVVWVIMPPLKREGLQTSERERRLLEATGGLIAAGEPVLVTFARSLLPLFGQKDPWGLIAEQLGITVDTGRVVMELVATSADRSELQPWQMVEQANTAHPIGAAVHGQPTVFNHPTPMSVVSQSTQATVIEAIESSANRWIEDDWREERSQEKSVPQAKRLTAPVPVVLALESTDEATRARRRAVAVGSGGWLLSSLADVSQTLGGNRYVLTNPGNRELMLASVAWLSGEEALLGGATGREVARVGDISDRARTVWLIALALGMPAIITATGIGVWVRRRRDR